MRCAYGTGVRTCALPILFGPASGLRPVVPVARSGAGRSVGPSDRFNHRPSARQEAVGKLGYKFGSGIVAARRSGGVRRARWPVERTNKRVQQKDGIAPSDGAIRHSVLDQSEHQGARLVLERPTLDALFFTTHFTVDLNFASSELIHPTAPHP